MIHETAIVHPSVKIGEETNVWAFSQIREGAVVGKGCTVGVYSYIERNIRIGNNVKLMGHINVGRGVVFEDDIFVGPMVVFANDRNPRHDKIRDLAGIEWTIKRGASIGTGSIVMPDVNIGRYALVGSGSLVAKDVPDHGLVYGSPAKLKGFVCFCGEKLPIEKAQEADGKMKLVCLACKKEVFVDKNDFQKLWKTYQKIK